VQPRRCDTPRRVAHVTCSRRAGTLTIFCGDLLHHLDLEVALGHQLLQPSVFLLELLQPPNVVGLERPEPLLPRVHRLVVHLVPPGDHRNPVAIPLAEDRHHLLFREPRLAHAPALFGKQSLT
jgi:hypothetical protein